MDFTSPVFLWFALLAIPLLRSTRGMRHAGWLLAATSAVFYAYLEPVWIFGFMALVGMGWCLGLVATWSPFQGRRPVVRHIFGFVSMLAVLAPLLITKYATWATEELGLKHSVEFVLPLGISFFSFQIAAFVGGAWRSIGQQEAPSSADQSAEYESGLLHGQEGMCRTRSAARGGQARRGVIRAGISAQKYAATMLAFPQVVAGPIVRLHELGARLGSSWAGREGLREGGLRFLLGVAKKLVLADPMGRIADPVFQNPAGHSSAALWAGMLAYGLQIYLDFSAYSDMALGVGRMLGLRLPENFLYPYRARSLQEFWRTWHRTLSMWLRDYLYIPLGGNRHGLWRALLALAVTMALGGLWHGAAWPFVIWGALHGVLLCVELVIRQLGWGGAGSWWERLGRVRTVFLVFVLWVPFRMGPEAMGWAKTKLFWAGMFGGKTGAGSDQEAIWVLLLAVAVWCAGPRSWSEQWRWLWNRPGRALASGALAGLLAFVVVLVALEGRSFVYFVF